MSIPNFNCHIWTGWNHCNNIMQIFSIKVTIKSINFNSCVIYHLQYLPPQQRTISLTQSVWCSIACQKCSLVFLQFHILMILSRPAEYSRFIWESNCKALTPDLLYLSISSRMTKETYRFIHNKIRKSIIHVICCFFF